MALALLAEFGLLEPEATQLVGIESFVVQVLGLLSVNCSKHGSPQKAHLFCTFWLRLGWHQHSDK